MLNQTSADLRIPNESRLQRLGIKPSWRGSRRTMSVLRCSLSNGSANALQTALSNGCANASSPLFRRAYNIKEIKSPNPSRAPSACDPMPLGTSASQLPDSRPGRIAAHRCPATRGIRGPGTTGLRAVRGKRPCRCGRHTAPQRGRCSFPNIRRRDCVSDEHVFGA